MAGGVHAPSDVVHEEDSHQSTPDPTRPSAAPTHRNDATEHGRQDKSKGYPEREQSTGHAQRPARGQVFDVVSQVRRIRFKEPTHMRMPKAFQQSEHSAAMMMRSVRVVERIGMLMMPAV